MTTPRLSEAAASILDFQDPTPDTPFTFEDYASNFNGTHKPSSLLKLEYDFLAQHAESGGMNAKYREITESTARRYNYYFADNASIATAKIKLAAGTFLDDGKRFIREFVPSFINISESCGEGAARVTDRMAEGPGKALVHSFYFASAYVRKAVNGLREGIKEGAKAEYEGVRVGDPELAAHGAFALVSSVLSALLLKKGITPIKSVPSLTPAFAQATGVNMGAASLEASLTTFAAGPEAIAGLGLIYREPHEEVVEIPEGEYVRGSETPGVSFEDEAPVQIIGLSPFKVMRGVVTNEAWLTKYWLQFRHTPFAILGREATTGIWRVVKRGASKADLTYWLESQEIQHGPLNNGEFVFDRSSLKTYRVIPEEALPSPRYFDDGLQPVVRLTWEEAVAAADGIGRTLEGKPGHLGTEAQWEVAARGPLVKLEGIPAGEFADFVQGPQINGQYVQGRFGQYDIFSLLADPDKLVLGQEIFTNPNAPVLQNALRNGQPIGALRAFPTRSGSFSPEIWSSVWDTKRATRQVPQGIENGWGLLDMSGNVWEWTNDWYADSYRRSVLHNPAGPATGKRRVVRGTSFDIDSPRNFRGAERFYDASSDVIFGLRVFF